MEHISNTLLNSNKKTLNKSDYIKNCFSDSTNERFNDDNPSVYLWLEQKDENRIKLIDKDSIIELKTGNYAYIVITNCGFLAFLNNSNQIIAIYDLFEEEQLPQEFIKQTWKDITTDFSFFKSYNYITTPLNYRRIYIKDGKLDLDKVKKYTKNNTKYYNINVDALSSTKETPNDEGFFFNVSMNEVLIYFRLKPNFKISFFDSAGTTLYSAINYIDIINTSNCTTFTDITNDSIYVESLGVDYNNSYLMLDLSQSNNFTGYIEVL